jgi:uncharacterized hydrophobic protein (TIGR00271 family)
MRSTTSWFRASLGTQKDAKHIISINFSFHAQSVKKCHKLLWDILPSSRELQKYNKCKPSFSFLQKKLNKMSPITTVDDVGFLGAGLGTGGEVELSIDNEVGVIAESATKTEAEDSEKQKEGEVPPPPRAVIHDLDSMKDAVWFLFPDRSERLSRFWLLLILAAIIATSGVIGDSPATVIGAMIVAPLMTPILGMMLSIVLTDGPNFRFSLFMVVAGVSSCILVGVIYGLISTDEIYAKENNSQVASRVSPKIPDLLGALATGAVGSISLVRKDIAGALPGVAISISLVPPLCVCGLTMSAGEFQDSAGAILLFFCNLMSIQVTGVVVMYIYGVQKMAQRPRAQLQRNVFLILLLMLGAIAVPLGVTSFRVAKERNTETCVREFVGNWAEPQGWRTSIVVARSRGNLIDATVLVSGSPPFPDESDLDEGKALKKACPDLDSVAISFVPVSTFTF